MIILEDTRQQPKKHDLKREWFESHGVRVERSKLYVGDYAIPSKQDVAIDTKRNILEVYGNLTQDHERFRNEAIRAREAGIRLIVLIENTDGITDVDGVVGWKNPRWGKYHALKKQAERKGRAFTQKPPMPNPALVKMLHTMEEKYGIEWRFCRPEEAGEMIMKILGGDGDGEQAGGHGQTS